MCKTVAAAVLGCALLGVTSASGGVFTDDMSKCLVAKTSDSDKTALVEWIFAAFALHPKVQAMANISPAQHEAISRSAGQMVMRLLTVDCRKETVAAVKYEGSGAIESAFGVLGEAATQGLMNDPAVDKGMEDLGKDIDEAQLQELFREAGVPTKGDAGDTK